MKFICEFWTWIESLKHLKLAYIIKSCALREEIWLPWDNERQNKNRILETNVTFTVDDFIQEIMGCGFGFPLLEIRHSINDEYDNVTSSKEAKLFICKYFDDQVHFVTSDHRNESMMVFPSKLTVQEVIAQLSSIDIVKDTSEMIKIWKFKNDNNFKKYFKK